MCTSKSPVLKFLNPKGPRAPKPWLAPLGRLLILFRTKFSGWCPGQSSSLQDVYGVCPFWLSTWLWFFAPGKTITSRASLRISKSSLCRSLRRSPRSVTPSCPRCDVVLSCADCAGLAAPASVQLRRCSDTGAQSTVVGCSYPWWNSGNNAKGVRGIFARD